jgi:hypothetical protein
MSGYFWSNSVYWKERNFTYLKTPVHDCELQNAAFSWSRCSALLRSPKFHYHFPKNSTMNNIQSQLNSTHSFTPYLWYIHCSTLVSRWCSFEDLQPTSLCIPHLPHACYLFPHFTLLDLITLNQVHVWHPFSSSHYSKTVKPTQFDYQIQEMLYIIH